MSVTPERNTELLLLILSQLPGIGPARSNAITSHFGPDPALLDAGADALGQVSGIGETLAGEIALRLGSNSWRRRALDAAEEQIDRTMKLGATLVTSFDPSYPALLRQIYDPPPLLFVRGNPSALSNPSLAVVGTRKASSYGKQATESFCRDLVNYGYTIFSGLAYGIDMTAHRSALDAGGTTVAVLGCGIDTIYTDPSGRLWPKILDHGAIISEEWIGSEPAAGNFPRRNRLISGMTSGTLVVESDIKGGSMITASCAIEQNREVFAVPGSIFSRTSRGTNRLIQQCQAKPVFSVEDIIAELPPIWKIPGNPVPETLPFPADLSIEESRIFAALEKGALHIDIMSEISGLSIETLLVHLFELEMRGAIEQEPGQLFRIRQKQKR
ncbi:MAG: DNA-protecting protein DprA [Chlorobiaceae bacterium]|nr:DNA-protecting protein DprA [Chlorobiaceae bacterium]